MKPINIALVGAGGYGEAYLRWFKSKAIPPQQGTLVCIVDPYASASHEYDWICSEQIPVYLSLEEAYTHHELALVIIASPTPFHKEQSLTALAHGSYVLCEKPLAPIVQDVWDLKEAEEASGGFELGVGYQWSFSRTMQTLKQDILAGKYGKPLLAKTFISWPRATSYYTDSNWKGQILAQNSSPILDSVLANATAHYLHNIFFVLGDALNTSAFPVDCSMELYRANPIPSFDTCVMRGTLTNGATYYYSASHAVAENHSPTFVYEFEKGTVSFNHWEEDDIVRGVYSTGEVTEYGNPFTEAETSEKVRAMIRSVREKSPVTCTTKTIVPHLLVSNATFDFGNIVTFPPALCVTKVGNLEGHFVPTLYATLKSAFEAATLPSEAGASWSEPPVTVSLSDYPGFTNLQGFSPQ